MKKFCIKWTQEDYEGKIVTLWKAFETFQEREDWIKATKKSADYIGQIFEIESKWIQED
jgi:hypothetical protein